LELGRNHRSVEIARIDAMRAFLHIILAVVTIGCSPKSDTPRQPASSAVTNGVDEAMAIAIARQAVSTNDTWVKRATFEAKRDGLGWSVFVQRHPIELGGHRIVKIDESGKVTLYIRGK
jgi:hypothetical protein